MQRFLTPLVLVALFASLIGGATPTTYASPDKPPVTTPIVTPPPSSPDGLQRLQEVRASQEYSCNSSPFGGQLIVGGENEMFVSYNDEVGNSSDALITRRFDRAANGDLALLQTTNGADIGDDHALANVRGGSSVAADLNGDGRLEFVQVTRDGSNAMRVVVSTRAGNGSTISSWRGTIGDYAGATMYAATTANFLRQKDATTQQIAVALRTANGNVHVDLWSGAANGSIAQADNELLAQWHGVSNLTNIQSLSLAAADVDGDGYAELALLVQYQNAPTMLYLLSNRANVNTWQTIATTELSPQYTTSNNDTISKLILKGGDIDGDFSDELIVGYATPSQSSNAYYAQLGMISFKHEYDATATPTDRIVPNNSWIDMAGERVYKGFDISLADTDQDGIVEPVLGFWRSGNAGVYVVTLDAEASLVVVHNRWFGSVTNDGTVEKLAVDAADLNKDGYADIVLTYLDTNNLLKVMRLEDQSMPMSTDTTNGIALRRTWAETSTARTTLYSLAVHMGDWDNDSLKAVSRIGDRSVFGCYKVNEPQVSTAIFVPPTWQNIQTADGTQGSIGRLSSTSATAETSYIAEHSHSATVSLGVEVDAEVAEISVKATAGREWAESQTNANSTTNSVTIQTEAVNTKDFVVLDNSNYNCYTYSGQVGSARVSDSLMRLCSLNGVAKVATSMDGWDNTYSDMSQWTPIVRDWSSLTQFRGPYAKQSSTAGSASAANAVDTNVTLFKNANNRTIKNPISETVAGVAGNSAWWQVDLGSVQDITKVRLWNGDDAGCKPKPCGQRLRNFHVFVSDTDPSLIADSGNVATLMGNGAVKDFAYAGIASEVVTLVTDQQVDGQDVPVRGRFVRVQLADAGALALSEVQVLGDNHVEPSRYPTSVQPGPAGSGYFLVTMIGPNGTPVTVRNRGTLLWNGADHNVLTQNLIGEGGGTIGWALTQENAQGTTNARSTTNSYSVGAEIDVALGVVVKATVGASYQYTRGVTQETSTTYEYGEGLEMSGTVAQFPEKVDNKNVFWPAQCRYGMVPYYYEITEVSTAAVTQKMLMLDYAVPSTGVTGLDRTRNLAPCLRGDSAMSNSVNLSATTLPFGNQKVNVTSATQTFTITNYTNTPLSLDEAVFGGTAASAYTLDASKTTCPLKHATRKLDTFTSCTVGVRFKPTVNGVQNATVSINTLGSQRRTLTVNLAGTGVSAAVALSTTSLAFGQQQINTTSPTQQVTVRNTGTAPLQISSIKVSAGFTQTRTCPVGTATLPAGATCTISVAFSPTAKGAVTGSLTITDDAGGSPRTVALRGVGASIGLSATALNFGTRIVNTGTEQNVIITNNGTVALPISAITISGPQAASFGRAVSCTSINPGASCRVSVIFQPTASGPQQAMLNIVYNQGTAPRTVGLMGIGTTLEVSTTALAFGDQKVGTTSTAQVVTLTNRGGWAITLGAQTMGGAFPANFIRTTTCGSSLAANASCTISVAFTPKTTGAKTATISIASNAAGNPHAVTLGGNGTP